MARTTISDVAKAAGVSTATVSYVLNRPQHVTNATRAKVLDAIERLGYVRNASARQLRDGRSRIVGLVIIDSNPFNIELTRGVEDAVVEEGHVVVVCNSATSAAREARNLRLLTEQNVDKVLITPVSRDKLVQLDQLRDRGASIVFVDYPVPRKDHCSVSVDDKLGGRLAAEHLIGLGHTRLALINGHPTMFTLGDRRKGFVAGLEAAGLELAPARDIETESVSVAAGEEAAGRLLDGEDRPTAVFCGNDTLAIGALRAAIRRGLSVPDDLAIVGYDDLVFAELSAVPLTTIRQPSYQLGYRAAKLLLDEAENRATHRHKRVVFRPELIVRASTVRTPATVSSRGAPAAAAADA